MTGPELRFTLSPSDNGIELGEHRLDLTVAHQTRT